MAAVKRQRRKKRAAKILATVVLVFIAAGIILALLLARRPYATISLKDFYIKNYSGYNGKGTIEVRLDEGRFNERIADAIAHYRKSLFKGRGVTEDDYRSLISTLRADTPPAHTLHNGDTVNLLYSCDMALAGKLNIKVEGREEQILVAGLKDARAITVDDLFRDLELRFEGESPHVTLSIVNHSTDDFIQNIVYSPTELKDFYEVGETVAVRAYFSEAECLKQQIVVEEPSTACIREYTVEGVDEYVGSAAELSPELIKEAVEAGKRAFHDANTWGVRVFIEAGLVPIYINKNATFEWLSPSVHKVYFKSVKAEAAGKSGNHYNDLDIIYSCDMTQADGVTTSVRAAVRFSNIIKKADGSLQYDFSDPLIISASHIAGNITKVVVDYFEEDYNIEEIPLG